MTTPPAELLAATHTPDALLVLDTDGVITYANPAAGRLLHHHPPDTLVGQPLEQVADLRDPAGRPWWRCTQPLRRLPAVRGTPSRELHLVLDPATTRLIDLTATFVRDGPVVTHTICALRDATARRRADTATAQLTATLAHELRSPLTSVKGFSATLLRRWDRFDDDQKRHMLATITTDADRVASLLNQLLDVARVHTGRLQLHPQPTDLADLAAAVAERTRTAHPGRSLQIRFPPAPLEVYADRDRIEQALGNLVEYTVSHTRGTVTLTADADHSGVEVAVTGHPTSPVPPEQLPLLFTRPDRAPHTHGAPPASGDLSLYIARGLIRAHHGRAWAHTPNRSLQLRFRLPR